MKIQEVSKDIIEGEIVFSSLKTSYMEANIQKDEETKIYAPEHTHRRPKHGPCALSMHFLHTHAP